MTGGQRREAFLLLPTRLARVEAGLDADANDSAPSTLLLSPLSLLLLPIRLARVEAGLVTGACDLSRLTAVPNGAAPGRKFHDPM